MKINTFFALALLFSLSIFAQHENGFLKINEIIADARRATKAAYPNANDVMVNDEIVTTYKPDGTSVTWDDTAVKVLTEEGRNDNRILRFHFNQSYGSATVTLVQTISENGDVMTYDTAKISSVTTDNSQMNSNIYDPNDKILLVNIPELELGDVVRYVAKRETTKPRMPNTFSDIEVFEYTSPILSYSYTVNAPSELPLTNRALLAPNGETVTYSSQATPTGITHRWTARNVPQAFPEPKMPSLYSCVQRLLVSTIPSWEYVSKWYWNLCLPHLKTTPEIEEKVKELCRDKNETQEKIRAIFKFVSQEIRYMGETTETEAPGYEPHDVSQTFSKRHGVCRDKAALLAAMLRTAGLEAFPVLINAGPLKDIEVPQPYFNHAITAVRDNGTYILMDSTDESTAELFPAYLGHKSYLVACPEGETLRVSDVPDADTNLMRITTHCDVNANGDLSGHSMLSFGGINDNAYRGFFMSSTAEEGRLFIQRMLRRSIPGATVRQFMLTPEDMRDTETPLALEVSFTAPSPIGGNDMLSFFNYPQFNGSIGIVNFILRNTSLDKRRFPFLSNYKCAIEEKLTVNMDPSFGTPVMLPDYKNIESDFMTWKRTVSYKNNQIDVFTRYAIETVQFSPEQYGQLKDNLKTIAANNKKIQIFNRQDTDDDIDQIPDVVILDERSDYALEDEYTWTETHYSKMQISSYEGKKEYSEITINYIPDQEEAKIDFANVFNGETCTKLNLNESKLMDADWNAKAPRYPKGRILVANLPSVEIGSVIEWQYTIVHKSKTVPFSIVSTFRSSDPIASKSISVSFPMVMRYSSHLSQSGLLLPDTEENIQETIEDQDERTTITWKAENQSPIARESNLPRLRYFLPSVTFSTGNKKLFLSDVEDAFYMKAIPGEQIKKLAEEMQGMDALRKVKAIRDKIAREIRTAGPVFTSIPFDKFSSAEETLSDKYGNSMDRAILAYALLKAAGLKPELILVKGMKESQDIEKDLASKFFPQTFSVPLIRVKASGIECWLNESDQYAELGTCLYESHSAITLDGKQFTIQPASKFQTEIRTDTNAKLGNDGSASIDVAITFYGNEFNSMKKQISEQTPEDRRRFILSTLDAISPSAKLQTEAGDGFFTNFDNYPGSISFRAFVPDYASVQEDIMNVPVDSAVPFAINENRRLLPFEYKSKEKSISTTTIELPYDFQNVLYAPQSIKIKFSQNAQFTIQNSCKNGVFKSVITENLSPFLTKAEQVPELQEQLHSVETISSKSLILSK